MMSKEWLTENEPEIKAFLMRNAVYTMGQPLEYAKTLIQLGYEPFLATESTGIIFRTKYLGLPNVLSYLKYIKSVDGFIGCYRGLLPRLCYANLYFFVYNKVSERNPIQRGDESEMEKRKGDPKQVGISHPSAGLSKYVLEFLPPDFHELLKTLSWDVVSVTVGTTAAYPFHVLAVRSMAQFVGRETKYETLWGSIVEIFDTEGIMGFFKGLIPRLIGEVLTVVIAGTFVFVVTKHLTNKHQQFTNLGGSLVANSFAYQYAVVSNNMAVNNTGLMIGNPPYTKKYSSWYDCWATLRREGQLSRASNVIGRAYTGPAEMRDGHLVPSGFTFGPIHQRGLGQLEQRYKSSLY